MTRERLEAIGRLVRARAPIPLHSWLDLFEHVNEQTAELVTLRAATNITTTELRTMHAAELEAHGFHAAASILRSPPVGSVDVDHTVSMQGVA